MIFIKRLPGKARILFVLLFAAIICLLALPYGMSYLITHALTSVGMRSVHIDDVDFNPFSGTFAIDGLRMLNLQQQEIRVPKLQARFAWFPLLKKRLVVERLLVQRVHITLQQDERGEYRLAGMPLPLMMEMAQGESSLWNIDIKRVLFGGTLSLYLPWYEGTVNLDSLQVSDISSMRANKPFRISAIVHATGATLILDGTLSPFGEKASASGTLKIQRLSLADVQHMAAPWLPDDIAALQGRLDAQLSFTLLLHGEQAGSLKLHEGRLVLRDPAMEFLHNDIAKAAADTLSFDAISYDGAWHLRQGQLARLRMQAGHGEKKMRQTYDVAAEKLTFSALDMDQQDIHLKDVKVGQGHIDIHAGQQQFQFEAARLTLKSLHAGEKLLLQGISADGLNLFLPAGKKLQARYLLLPKVSYADAWQLAEVTLDELDWQDASAQRRLGRFTAKQLRAADAKYRQDGHFSMHQLDIEQPAGGMETAQIWAGKVTLQALAGRERLNIGSIRISDSRMQLLRDKKKHWWFGDVPLASLFRGHDEQPWLQRVDHMQMRGGFIAFRDTSVSPAYSERFSLIDARIRELDRTRPAHFSPFSIRLAGRGGAEISMHGRVRPFSRQPALASKTSIHSFSLPSISPLLAESLGYGAKTGQLDADITLNIEQGRLQGESRLLLRQLEVTRLQTRGKARGDGGLSMPLDTALDMLRNSDNDIELSIPVSGDIRNPKFNYQDAINKALGTALQKAALGYIAQTLQPYGALVTVADLAWSAGKKMMVVRLEPLLFTAGSAQTDEGQSLPYMEHLAGLMNKKTSLRLTLCGKATEADRQALQQAEKKADEDVLLALAKARAQHIQDMLMTRFGLNSERLFLCQEEIDAADDAKPRLEMTLH